MFSCKNTGCKDSSSIYSSSYFVFSIQLFIWCNL